MGLIEKLHSREAPWRRMRAWWRVLIIGMSLLSFGRMVTGLVISDLPFFLSVFSWLVSS